MQDFLPRLHKLREYFNAGATRDHAFRKKQLEVLRQAVLKHEGRLTEALHTDLKKGREESWVTEIGFVLAEIRHALKHLKAWMKPQRVSTNLLNQPSRSYIYPEPLGVVLVVAPWNYPFMLLLAPVVGAVAAGNCVVLKPSEYAPATSAAVKAMLQEAFADDYVLYAEGDGAEVVPALLNGFRFDHVFYTGSTAVGQKVYELAAKQLVPVTLELGGKSPCVVESDADVKVAARRLAVTKFSNAGQMCVAPDYLLVHVSEKEAMVQELKSCIQKFYGADAKTSAGYGKIINQRSLQRLIAFLQEGTVVYGGTYDAATGYFEPTVVENVSVDHAVMGEEIFGPVLPVLTFQSFEEAKAIINRNPNPLAFYVFTSDKQKEERWLREVPFGGGCVNNAAWHLTNLALPFGGRGNSGIGAYHGKFSFDTFSHRKAVMKTPTWFDPAFKYPPFEGKLKWFKKVVG